MGEEQPCPNCKKNVSRSNFTVHNVHCQRNIISCSLCHEPVPRSQYQQHVESSHSSIECQLCGSQVESVKIFYHQSTFCPKRLLVCSYCELEVTAVEFEKHSEFCGARTDRCKGCTKYVQFKYLQFHYEHDHKYLNPEEKEKAEIDGSEGDDGEECPICLGPVTLPLTLECGHVFCMVCVKGIANTTKNCAICRRDIQRDMLMDIRFCREEDIIKNYVNNPKYKKRSKSVPSRRVGITTEDYDNMVSALLSSRTSSSNYRYQRPNNGHTPPNYTPYCYSVSNSTSVTTSTHSSIKSATTTTSSSNSYKDDDCCCSSTKESSTKISNNQTVVPPPRANSAVSRAFARSASVTPTVTSKNETKHSQTNVESTKSFTTSKGTSEDRPKRPTSLALQTDDMSSESNISTKVMKTSEPHHLSQEEYDRWFAFQLAQAEDEISAAEFNKIQRSPFRRSRSMPERKDDSPNFVNDVEKSFTPSMDRCEETKQETQSRLPPTSPRCTTANSSLTSSFTFASSSKGSNLSKSSSDSSANGNVSTSPNSTTAMSTGARPKSSTGLKKRVSFKDETPRVKRQAPVMLPCEFCDEVFPERDLMRHQTSCDQNETKNPREYLLSRRSSITSPVTSPTSPLSPTPSGLNTSLTVAALSRPPLVSSYGRSSESSSSTTTQLKNMKTPPQSPSPRPRPNQSTTSPLHSPSSSNSPQLTNVSNENCYSPYNSRHASISPGPGVSVSSSSGVSSGMSSINSSPVSSTPNTSSSASPIPAITQPSTPGTPTDIEVDFEEDDSAFSRPRKGRLISSAITSWRSISGSKPNMKYARSNTAPLEITLNEDLQSSEITTCYSATQIRAPLAQDDSDEETEESKEVSHEVNPPIFIKNKNKYPAPPPPQNRISENKEKVCNIASRYEELKQKQVKSETCYQRKEGKSNFFKFDSFPIMNTGVQMMKDNDVIPCEFCKEVFPPEKFQAHQAVCEEDKETPSQTNHSRSEEQQGDKEQNPSIPARRNKGPAPQPPSEAETPKRKQLERSHSVRESSSESRNSKEFESSGRRLERACSIKETSRFATRSNCDSPPRQWLSREGFYGSSLDCSAAYSAGGSVTSSTTSINSYSGGHGWSSHVNMIREEARSRRASYIYAGTNSPTTPFFGATRYRDRSSSRHRPSSLYASRNAFTIIADAFAAATEKKQTPRRKSKKGKAPDPPAKKVIKKSKFKIRKFGKLKNLVRKNSK